LSIEISEDEYIETLEPLEYKKKLITAMASDGITDEAVTQAMARCGACNTLSLTYKDFMLNFLCEKVNRRKELVTQTLMVMEFSCHGSTEKLWKCRHETLHRQARAQTSKLGPMTTVHSWP
jgi:hypothetical protein